MHFKSTFAEFVVTERASLVSHLVKGFWFVLFLSVLLPTGAEEIDTTIPLVRDFQKIGDGPEKLFVYSAYFDEFRGSDRGSVRILGGVKTIFPRPLYCKFYNREGQHYSTIEAEVRSISENFGFEYSASFITCRVLDFYTLPSFVSLVETARDPQNVTNVLRVKYPEDRKREDKIKFSVCVQPTYNYDRPLQFAEWMEFHKLMGVEKFTFYNVSIGPETSCLMNTYGDEVEILPWTSSYKPEEEIRMHSQFIGAQDCLYRNRGVSENMIYVDLDEMIIPRYGRNYSQFFDFLQRELRDRLNFQKDIVSYNFRNGFFFDTWEDDVNLPTLKIKGDAKADNIIRQLQISKKTRRSLETEPHDIRSKFIVVPEKAIELGNHAVFEAAGNTIRVAVPEELAYSHHYRVCLADLCEIRQTIVERSAQRFAEEVALQVSDRLYNKAKHCRILADDDEEDAEIDLSPSENALESETKLEQYNSNQYLNSSSSDWSLNSLLSGHFNPNAKNAVKVDQKYPLFGSSSLTNSPLSIPAVLVDPKEPLSVSSYDEASVQDQKTEDGQSESLSLVTGNTESDPTVINGSEWLATVEYIGKIQTADVDKYVASPEIGDSQSQPLVLPQNINITEVITPSNSSSISDENLPQESKE